MPVSPSASRWEPDIAAFEASDQQSPPPDDAILFVGSSSIRLWETLADDFAGLPVFQRGFGGALLRDVLHFAPRIILPYRPRQVIVYGGSLDLRHGSAPEDVADDLLRLTALIREALPRTTVGFISLKPSLAKWESIGLDVQVNELVQRRAEGEPGLEYVDIFGPMTAESVPPPARYFVADRNHLSREGYALWADIIRPFLRAGSD